jgi:ADP-heptose:LPS heptosyltransferase
MRIHQQQRVDKYFGYFLIALLLPVARLLGIFMRRDHSLSSSPQHILCIKILGLGSVVLAVDAVKHIKQKYPYAKLILLTDINIANGIIPFHLFDEVWTIQSSNIFSVGKSALQYLFRSWRLKRLWIIDLEVYSKLTTVYALLTAAQNRFGFYLSPVFFRKHLNTHNILFNRQTYLEDNYNYMASVITKELYSSSNHLPVRKKDVSKPFIALNNTCSGLAWVRKLPDDLFLQICNWILENTSYCLALLGAPEDKKNNSLFIEASPQLAASTSRIENIAGKFDFPSYYRFLTEECVCIVSIDSAPLHIAKKLGVPTVSIWGPTNPANYLKINPVEQNKHLFHYLNVPCSPCIHYHKILPCGGNNTCMKNIEATSITEKIKSLLNTIATSKEA